MNADRLEELSRWAEAESKDYSAPDVTEERVNLADLARCARAWAKVERLIQEHYGSSITLVRGHKNVICLNVIDKTTGDTTMEAIEAIPIQAFEAAEVKP